MKTQIKRIITLTLVAVMALGLVSMVGCGDKNDEGELTGWDYIQDKGTLVIGLDDTFAPMGFRDEDGNLVGFDIDLANAVGEALGITVEFQPVNWESKEMELSSKKIDCIWNGLSITDERKESLALTKLYLNNRNVIMTLSDDVVINSEEDLAKYNIGTQTDSSTLKVMQESNLWDTYGDKVTDYPTFDEAILDMKAGRVDCIVVDEVLGEYKNNNLDAGDQMKLCKFDFGDDFYTIGCRKEDTDVAAKLNEGLKTVIDSGKAEEISNKWFGKNIVILKDFE